ncbi:MAG: formate/nitrite transporter family protein [Deltaproteobacteria bacterium]|jgi:formate/nitrite transporter|nr:formate/nitrite transporter family protein [Deltaproteobacteria bacterium]
MMNAVKTSAEIIETVCNEGLSKSKLSLRSNLTLACMAGFYVGFGAFMALRIAAGMNLEIWGSLQRLAFGVVFPVGLLLVLMAGAELFTGNCLFMPCAMVKHGVGLNKLFRILILTYIGNLVGSIFVSWLGNFSGVLADKDTATYIVTVANGKCDLPFSLAFVRGIFCNWLVCLAIYLTLAARDGVSKILLLWPPITTFAALGFEHSVANMTFIPLGIFTGSSPAYLGTVPLTANWYGFFISNLIPVTLGNIIGGAIFVGLAYYFANGLKRADKN